VSRRDHEEDYDEYYDDEYEDDYDRRPRRARRRTGCWLLIVVLAVLATCGWR
jgi:hypothetical protein